MTTTHPQPATDDVAVPAKPTVETMTARVPPSPTGGGTTATTTTVEDSSEATVARPTEPSPEPSVAAVPDTVSQDVPPVADAPLTAPTPPSKLTGQARSARTRELFTEALDAPDERVAELHDEVIVMHLDLAHAEARRYRSRGVPLDDLRQVAALALTKATNGYDVTSGHDFLSYAVPTIRGELRKHFRDHGWMVRPPRRIQELQARINHADGELANALGRAPQPREVAEHLGEPLASVIEALASDGCFVPASLDHPAGGGDGTTSLGDLLPLDDADHRASEARLLLRPVLNHLSDRDRDILAMRFHEGLTQREIAARIGVTQMQVSRLLGRILGQLRHDVGDVEAD